MTALIDTSKTLPQFRSDLQLYRGPDDPEGAPTYNLFDPVRVRYFKISWAESLVLQHLKPNMDIDELIGIIEERSTLKISSEEIVPFFEEAMRYGLLSIPRSSESILMEHDLNKVNPFYWLLIHYLYIRIPLLNPDPFLTRTIKWFRPFGSFLALIFYGILIAIGFYCLLTRFEEFLNTFTYFFSIQGFFAYGLAIFFVKIVHEFSHAYTAKNFGLHVPTMGIALLVLWPVLYTDVTDGWKLRNRRHRLLISGAGIIAELIIAGLSTIGWYISPPGVIQSVFFVMASLTWISTLLINLNPAMRFDGYYIMCDLWGIDNLQPRAFAITRWKLREWFLGLMQPPPEEGLSAKRIRALILYTLYTWGYRIILYTAIAIFIYHTFTKALGVFLFFVEIGIFMVWPLIWEYQELKKLRDQMTLNPRSMATLAVVLGLAAWFILPLPHELRFSAVSVPVNSQIVRVPTEGEIKEINVKRGQNVTKGQLLAIITSRDVESKYQALEVQKRLLEQEILIYGITEEDRPFIAERQAELASVGEQYKTWKAKAEEMVLKAEVNGNVYDWDIDLHLGQPVAKDQVLGKIASSQFVNVVSYVPETDIEGLEVGQAVTFYTKSDFRKYTGKITQINLVNSDFLPHPVLASTHYGDLPVSDEPNVMKQGKLALVDTYYSVTARLDDHDDPLQYGQTGYTVTSGPWRSKLMRLIKFLTTIFWKESSV